jgi:Arc/MetJ family transcription regulator
VLSGSLVSGPLDSTSESHPQRSYREFTRAASLPVERRRRVIFKSVRDGRPYPDHGFTSRDWSQIPPHQVRLDELVTTKRELRLDTLLDEDSTFYGDLFPHAVRWRGELYLETGLHRALRAALQQRHVIHVRVLDLDDPTTQAKPT